MSIYLDSAADAPILPEVAAAVSEWQCKVGNPNSIHSAGREARRAIEDARASVARLINAADPSEIVFTSGGTEADNLAITGMAPYLVGEKKTRMAFSAVEHHAVLSQVEQLARLGVTVTLIPVDRDCCFMPLILEGELKAGSIGLVSVMSANNEVGTVQPIREVAAMCHEHGAFCHTDAVQALGHMKVDVQELGVDMLSGSAHKMGGPGGVGFFYIKKDLQKHLTPLIAGGGQELGLRSGTQYTAGIVGLGVAAELARKNLDANIMRAKMHAVEFWDTLRAELGCDPAEAGIRYNGECENLPNIMSLTIDGVESESLLLLMDADGVCISAASACSAGSLEPSHVLKAMLLSDEEAKQTVRISFGNNTSEEVVTAAKLLVKNVRRIRKMYGED